MAARKTATQNRVNSVNGSESTDLKAGERSEDATIDSDGQKRARVLIEQQDEIQEALQEVEKQTADAQQAFTREVFDSVDEVLAQVAPEADQGDRIDEGYLPVDTIGESFFRVWDREGADKKFVVTFPLGDQEKKKPYLLLNNSHKFLTPGRVKIRR